MDQTICSTQISLTYHLITFSGARRNPQGKLYQYNPKIVEDNKERRKTCNKKVVKKDWIENLVVREAAKILADDKVLEHLTDTLYEMQISSNLPRLEQQLADVEKGIENMVNAIQQGILTASTKERLNKLEAEKKEIEISIVQEQIRKPILSKKFIMFGICKFRKLDLDTREGKQRLIDDFVNAVYLYDDKIILTFNYKDGTKTISLADRDGSNLNCLGAPFRHTKKERFPTLLFYVFFRFFRAVLGIFRSKNPFSST